MVGRDLGKTRHPQESLWKNEGPVIYLQLTW